MVVGPVFDHQLLRQIFFLICVLSVRELESQRTLPTIQQEVCKYDAIMTVFYPG